MFANFVVLRAAGCPELAGPILSGAAEPSGQVRLRPFISLPTHERESIKTIKDFFQTNAVALRQAFDTPQTLCARAVFSCLRSWHKARGAGRQLGHGFCAASAEQLRALARRRALRCKLFPGGALGPAFLAPAAVFAFRGGVSGGSAGRAALPGAGRSPLLAAVPGEGKVPRQGQRLGKGREGIRHPGARRRLPWRRFAVVADLEQHLRLFLLGLPVLLQPAAGRA